MGRTSFQIDQHKREINVVVDDGNSDDHCRRLRQHSPARPMFCASVRDPGQLALALFIDFCTGRDEPKQKVMHSRLRRFFDDGTAATSPWPCNGYLMLRQMHETTTMLQGVYVAPRRQ
jgi:hypothetical protein